MYMYVSNARHYRGTQDLLPLAGCPITFLYHNTLYSTLQCTPCREGTGWLSKIMDRFGTCVCVCVCVCVGGVVFAL